MNRDQAQPGARVTWTRPDGTHQTGTVLAAPADQDDHVLVAWSEHRLVPIDRLTATPES